MTSRNSTPSPLQKLPHCHQYRALPSRVWAISCQNHVVDLAAPISCAGLVCPPCIPSSCTNVARCIHSLMDRGCFPEGPVQQLCMPSGCLCCADGLRWVPQCSSHPCLLSNPHFSCYAGEPTLETFQLSSDSGLACSPLIHLCCAGAPAWKSQRGSHPGLLCSPSICQHGPAGHGGPGHQRFGCRLWGLHGGAHCVCQLPAAGAWRWVHARKSVRSVPFMQTGRAVACQHKQFASCL